MYIYRNPAFSSNLSKFQSFGSTPNNGVKVSVVVPVYNQEKYLKTALDSLQNQTQEENEFICVNDGSKDTSSDILHDYASKDKRFVVIDQKNQGAGPARNNGMKVAKGEFISFLDPDDWFEKDALKTVYETAKDRQCDMLVFKYNEVDEKTNKVTPGLDVRKFIKDAFPKFDENKNFTWENIRKRAFLTLLLMSWNKLIDRDLIQKWDLHFSDCSLSEDNVFVFGAMLRAKQIAYLDKALYYYLQRDGSAVHTQTDRNLCIFQAFDDVKKLLEEMKLSKRLRKPFDDYVVKILELNGKRILSQDKLAEMCKTHLTERQNKMWEKRKAEIKLA